MFNIIIFENLTVHEIMWKSTVEPDRTPMTIWRMRIACLIPKSANTHSEHVSLLLFNCNGGYTNAPHCYGIHVH